MKLKNLLWAALPLALTLASCSNDEPGNNGGGNDTFVGNGYMAVNISLPQTGGTRAVNDNFNDGLADEYKVNNAAIVLFTGDPTKAESTYVIKGAYTISPDVEGGDETVTRRLAKTFKVNNISTGDNEKIFALAMVNYIGRVTVDGGKLEIGEEDMTGKTFADLLGKTSNANFIGTDKNDFFMTNAVMSNIAGGAASPLSSSKADIFTLVQCADECIFDSEAEAKLKPACTINVERAVAKATLSAEGATVSIVNGDGLENAPVLTVDKVEWMLDNTEPTSYLVRNMGTAADTWMGYANTDAAENLRYRMAGALMSDKFQEKARTYWCVDPSYASAAPTLNTADESNLTDKKGDNYPQYCYENTFTAKNQNWKNTTRAVLKVTFKVDGESKDLYVGESANRVYYTDQDQTGIKSAFVNNANLMNAYKAYAGTGTHELENDFAFEYANVGGVQKIKSITVSTNINGAETATRVELYKAADGETAAVANPLTTTKEGTTTIHFTAAQVTALVAEVETNNIVNVYTGGVAYYQVRIKHFGDDLTPWNTSAHPVTLTTNYTTDQAYAFGGNTVDEAAFLGRYGMVRNNWYDINIGEFKRMGDNKFPTVSDKDTPDDTPDEDLYMSVRINVLSWAKRTQTELL